MREDWNHGIELIEGEVHIDYLRGAYGIADEKSDDPVTKTGALIVTPTLDQIISMGYNHFPRGLNPTKEQILDRDWKYKHILHAETSAIYAAALRGGFLDSAVMYMPWVPCMPCALAVVDSGIKTMIGHKEMIMKTPERWWESTDEALNYLRDAGVETYMVEGKIGGVQNLFNGEIWSP